MEKFFLWVFLARFTYMTSFHALGQVHIYSRSQGNKKITVKKMLKSLYSQTSKIDDLTFTIMQKILRFFLNEDFETALYFDSLRVKKSHCKLQSLLSFKSVLDNFQYAFSPVAEKDKYFSDNFSGFNPKVRDYQRNLNLLVKTLQIDVKTNVQTQFNITTIKDSTKNFVADAGGKTRSSICLKMKQDMCVRKVIVLTVLDQFTIFLLLLEDCLINNYRTV